MMSYRKCYFLTGPYLVFTTTEEDKARLIDYFKKTHQLSWRTGPIDGIALQTLQGAIELIVASKQFENESILPDYLFPSADDVSFLVGYGGAYDGVYYELVVIDNLKSQIWYWELDT